MTAKQMIVLFFSALISYCVIFLVIRLSGKRTLSKMNAFDFIITVTMGAVFGAHYLIIRQNLCKAFTSSPYYYCFSSRQVYFHRIFH